MYVRYLLTSVLVAIADASKEIPEININKYDNKNKLNVRIIHFFHNTINKIRIPIHNKKNKKRQTEEELLREIIGGK